MAPHQNLSTRVLFFFFLLALICSSLVPSSDARKLLLNMEKNTNNNKDMMMKKDVIAVVVPSSLRDSLVLNALPKGSVPPSAPSKKGHAMININEKLFRTFATTYTTTPSPAHIDRILRSVPSPGVGH
ncbi:hypothetical protein BVC80_8927g22 [Macleaya cordata]|uniref:Uncharacterized protein n=1 Tax=Macleaya cordata TaxID=56857 RepID=A0A200R0F1_MACCD|nr:hypothetical protein BVC80_8927g22 [Macleaya cordata]